MYQQTESNALGTLMCLTGLHSIPTRYGMHDTNNQKCANISTDIFPALFLSLSVPSSSPFLFSSLPQFALCRPLKEFISILFSGIYSAFLNAWEKIVISCIHNNNARKEKKKRFHLKFSAQIQFGNTWFSLPYVGAYK